MAERKLGPRQALIGAFCFALLSLLVSWIYVAFIESDEAKVQRAIASMVSGAEARSPRAVTTPFSADFKFTGSRYEIGKDEVRQALTRLFFTQYKFGFEVTLDPDPVPIAVAEDGKTATCSFRATARGQASQDGEWISLRNREANGKRVYRASFKKTEDGWRLQRLRLAE
jgi:hypothetical protein